MIDKSSLIEKKLLEHFKNLFNQKQYDKTLKTFEEVFTKNANLQIDLGQITTACFEYATILKTPYSNIVDGLKIPTHIKFLVKASIGYLHGSPEGQAGVIKDYEGAVNWIEKNNLETIHGSAKHYKRIALQYIGHSYVKWLASGKMNDTQLDDKLKSLKIAYEKARHSAKELNCLAGELYHTANGYLGIANGFKKMGNHTQANKWAEDAREFAEQGVFVARRLKSCPEYIFPPLKLYHESFTNEIQKQSESFQLGLNHMNDENYSQASVEFNNLLLKEPSNEQIRFMLDISCFKEEEQKKTRINLSESVQTDKSFMNTLSNKGLKLQSDKTLQYVNSNNISEKLKTLEQPHSGGFTGLFIGKMPANTNTKIDFLYRGDDRVPSKIFDGGFKAMGNNKDLYSHLTKQHWQNSKSAYISTTTSKEIASTFPKDLMWKSNIGFLYEINPQKNSIDMSETIHSKYREGKINAVDYEYYLREKEKAVPEKIKSQDIKGAWQVEIIDRAMETPGKDLKPGSDGNYPRFVRTVHDTFLPNPQYVPPKTGEVKFSTTTKLGFAMTGVGVVLDGISLTNAYQQSKQLGNYAPFFQEGVRVIGGWSGALVLGSSFAEAGALSCSLLSPYGPPVCGLIGGLVGGFLGYWGGSKTAVEIYNHSKVTPEKPILPVVGLVAELVLKQPPLKQVIAPVKAAPVKQVAPEKQVPQEKKPLLNPAKCSVTLFANKEKIQNTLLKQSFEKTLPVKQSVPVPKTKREQRMEAKLQQRKYHEQQIRQRTEEIRLAKERKEKNRILKLERRQNQLYLNKSTQKATNITSTPTKKKPSPVNHLSTNHSSNSASAPFYGGAVRYPW